MTKNSDIEDIYGLLHQNMRDYLAALFLKNVLYRGKKANRYISNSVTSMMNTEVLTYLADISDEKAIDELWKSIKISENPESAYKDHEYIGNEEAENKYDIDFEYFYRVNYRDYLASVNWFIRFFGVKYNNDYSMIDFSDKDLRYVSLANCRSNSMLLSLSKKAGHFKNTLISGETFRLYGHTEAVSAIHIIEDLDVCLTGDPLGNIYGWDLVSKRLVLILKNEYGISEIKHIKKSGFYYIIAMSASHVSIFVIDKSSIIMADLLPVLPSSKYEVNTGFREQNIRMQIFQDEDTYICTSSLGGLDIYNIDKNEYKIIAPPGEAITNKLGVYEYHGQIYGIIASSDRHISLWNISEKRLIKIITYDKRGTIFKDVYSHIKGVTDFVVYPKDGEYNLFFSDSEGVLHVARDIFGSGNTSHRLRKSHHVCVRKIELFKVNNVNIATSSSSDSIIKWNLDTEEVIAIKNINAPKSEKDYRMLYDYRGSYRINESTLCQTSNDNIYIWDVQRDVFRQINLTTNDLWERKVLCLVYKEQDEEKCIISDSNGNVILCLLLNDTIHEYHRFPASSSEINDIKVFCKNDGNKYFAVASLGHVSIWNLDRNSCISLIEDHAGKVDTLCPCCGGERLITCGDATTVRIYNIKDLVNPKLEDVLSSHSRKDVIYGFSLPVEQISILSEERPFKFVTKTKGKFIIWEKSFNSYKIIRAGWRNNNSEVVSINGSEITSTENIPCDNCTGIDGLTVIDSKRVLTEDSISGNIDLWDLSKPLNKCYKKNIANETNQHSGHFIIIKSNNNKIYSLYYRDIIEYDYNSLKLLNRYTYEDNTFGAPIYRVDANSEDFSRIIYNDCFPEDIFYCIQEIRDDVYIGLRKRNELCMVEFWNEKHDDLSLSTQVGEIKHLYIERCFGYDYIIKTFSVIDEKSILIAFDDGRMAVCDITNTDDIKVIAEIQGMYGVSVLGLDFSEAIFTDDSIKTLLKQNGAKVDRICCK